MINDALSAVHLGSTMEQLALVIQIYIRMDRLDLAKETLVTMKSADEEAVLTQMSSVYVMIANGRSTAPDAVHTICVATRTPIHNAASVDGTTANNAL